MVLKHSLAFIVIAFNHWKTNVDKIPYHLPIEMLPCIGIRLGIFIFAKWTSYLIIMGIMGQVA